MTGRQRPVRVTTWPEIADTAAEAREYGNILDNSIETFLHMISPWDLLDTSSGSGCAEHLEVNGKIVCTWVTWGQRMHGSSCDKGLTCEEC